MIRGQTKNIAIGPVGYKDLDPEEIFFPYHIDLRNGKLTKVGNWKKRPGYVEQWDVTDNYAVHLLIPESTGYAVNTEGQVYLLAGSIGTATELTGQALAGTYRPTWANHNDLTIICDGGPPVKIEAGDTALLGGSPVNARFCARISSYLLLAGHDPTEFVWSAVGNPENYTDSGTGFANIQKAGETIRNMKALRENLFFFKDKSIEVWVYLGGATPFVRQDGAWMNKGLGADDSVVQANDTFYWYGDDGDFYVRDGGQPRVISTAYRKELDALVDPSSMYGFDCRKESVIRWMAPTDGRCFVYDYVQGNFSEDNAWANGQFERLPINAYMELNKEQYFGDYEPTGKVYHWSHDHKNDNGSPIRVYRRFALIPFESGHRGRYNRLRFRFKRGEGALGTTPEVFFRYRFDKEAWSAYEYLDMGVSGEHNPWIDTHNLGVGKEIEIEVVSTDDVDFILTHMNLTIRELGS